MDDYDGIGIICECVGRCGILSVERYEEDMWGIQYFIPARYAGAGEIGWKDTVKLIWALITGKKYWIYDIILNKKQMEKFREHLDKRLVDDNLQKNT